MFKRIIRSIFVGLFLFFFWPFFLYRKYGKKDIYFEDGSTIIANHYSDFDPFFIYLLARNRNRLFFITNAEVKKKWITRIFCSLFDCLYVEEDEGFKNVRPIFDAIKKLKEGKVMVIFPEGVIRPTKEGFFEFNKGFVFISRKANSTIYPLYIYPDLLPFKRTKIYINEPIPFKTIEKKDDLTAAFYLQSIVMDSSFKVDSKQEI